MNNLFSVEALAVGAYHKTDSKYAFIKEHLATKDRRKLDDRWS